MLPVLQGRAGIRWGGPPGPRGTPSSRRVGGALFLGLSALIWSAPLQDNRPEIHGVVYETGTTRGLAGAEIQLFETPGRKLIATAATDASGAFDFQPTKFGDYLVTADMEGYSNLPVNPLRNGFDTEATASLNSLHPTREVRLALARPGELTGRIIEDETGKPLVKFRILVAKSLYLNGQLRWWPGRDTVTDEDGQFDVTGLSPGSYVVMVSPQLLSKEQVVTGFSEADLKVVDQDYERSYWPGGHGLDQAFPVSIGSGGTASVGTLRLRRMPFYRVHASVSGADCASESKMQVQQTAVSYGMTETLSLGEVPCGQDFLIRNLQPRSYRITVFS